MHVLVTSGVQSSWVKKPLPSCDMAYIWLNYTTMYWFEPQSLVRLKYQQNFKIHQSYQVSEVSRLEVGLWEELLYAGDADGAGAAAGDVVVLLETIGAVVQGPERVSQIVNLEIEIVRWEVIEE